MELVTALRAKLLRRDNHTSSRRPVVVCASKRPFSCPSEPMRLIRMISATEMGTPQAGPLSPPAVEHRDHSALRSIGALIAALWLFGAGASGAHRAALSRDMVR